MNKNEQIQAADAAIEHAVERFVTDIDKIMVQRKAIAPHVREQALLILCDAMQKLSNALLDYRDSLPTECE
jgi:hypothetical protein